MKLDKWSRRYLFLAREVASWSKDPSAQIGAVIVGSKKEVLAQGFNGFPRGIEDTSERYNDKKVKHNFVVHAEMNAIFNASYRGISLNGATLYVYGLPICHECAKGVIQVGIARVVVIKTQERKRWNESFLISEKIFKEASVDFSLFSLDALEVD